ncbi:hypothetical protein EBR66_02865 [bacterium]|nr:hypothetical protein [bacterium]
MLADTYAMHEIVFVLVPATLSFCIGMLMTPALTYYLYAHKVWKKRAGKMAYDGTQASVFNSLHAHNEIRAPRMGGIVVWGSVFLTVIVTSLLSYIIPSAQTFQLDFLSRSQTWIPFATLLIGAYAGFLDDLMVVRESGEGMPLTVRLSIVTLFSTFIGWWFFAKLGVVAIGIPFFQPLVIGVFIIPFFVLMSLALYASGVIDGIDGLSGGVFGSIFAAYAIIAFVQGQADLAAFSAAIVGGILAFLWFNIPPARFYMSDTGTMGLTLCLGTIAFMTDTLGGGVGIFVLPVIGLLLVLTVLSDVLQLAWKKIFKRKLFRIAPLHHHFEALGWPGYKVTMRYWVLSVVFAFAGVIIAILGR